MNCSNDTAGLAYCDGILSRLTYRLQVDYGKNYEYKAEENSSLTLTYVIIYLAINLTT